MAGEEDERVGVGCWGLCGSTRSSGDSRPARHERCGAANADCAEDGRVRESLFHKSIKPANSWSDRLTTNGPEPVTFVLSLSKNEVRRLMKHRQRPRPYARAGRGCWRGSGVGGVVASSGRVVRHSPAKTLDWLTTNGLSDRVRAGG